MSGKDEGKTLLKAIFIIKQANLMDAWREKTHEPIQPMTDLLPFQIAFRSWEIQPVMHVNPLAAKRGQTRFCDQFGPRSDGARFTRRRIRVQTVRYSSISLVIEVNQEPEIPCFKLLQTGLQQSNVNTWPNMPYFSSSLRIKLPSLYNIMVFIYMSHVVRKWAFGHGQTANLQTNMCICAVWPEDLLFRSSFIKA